MTRRVIPVRVPVWVTEALARRAEISGHSVGVEAGDVLREALPQLALDAVRERLALVPDVGAPPGSNQAALPELLSPPQARPVIPVLPMVAPSDGPDQGPPDGASS